MGLLPQTSNHKSLQPIMSTFIFIQHVHRENVPYIHREKNVPYRGHCSWFTEKMQTTRWDSKLQTIRRKNTRLCFYSSFSFYFDVKERDIPISGYLVAETPFFSTQVFTSHFVFSLYPQHKPLWWLCHDMSTVQVSPVLSPCPLKVIIALQVATHTFLLPQYTWI